MTKSNPIPTIAPTNSEDFHFGNVKWKLPFPEIHNLFHINRLEDFRDKLSFPLPPHRKTVYDIIFLTQGESCRSKGLNQYTFRANDFFFLPAYQITEHHYMSTDIKGYYLHFDIKIFQLLSSHRFLDNFPFFDFLTNPVVSVAPEMQQSILNLFERLEKLNQKLKSEDVCLVAHYLLTLMMEAKSFVLPDKSAPKNSATQLTQLFKNALAQHIYKKQKINEYADLLCVTPNHLNKCVKATTDKTAQDLLKEMLILEAKSLLKYSNLSISQIAVQLCNEDPSNFARFFKSQTGISPKEYQQTAQ